MPAFFLGPAKPKSFEGSSAGARNVISAKRVLGSLTDETVLCAFAPKIVPINPDLRQKTKKPAHAIDFEHTPVSSMPQGEEWTR